MNFFKFPTYLFVLTLVISCNDLSHKKILPNITGKTGQILLVIDSTQWKGEIGEKIKKIFYTKYIGLPQPEPLFDLLNIHSRSFSNLFLTNRNILLVKINPQLDTSKITFAKNVWAEPQAYIKIAAKNTIELLSLLKTPANISNILSFFIRSERNRIITNYAQNRSEEIKKLLNEQYAIDLIVPDNFRIGQVRENFVWLAHETTTLSIGILVYKYKLNSNPVVKNFLINKRDSILQIHIKGPVRKNSYMQTEKIVEPTMQEIKLMNTKAIELRGLWNMKNDFMGGPFISYSIPNDKYIITTEGWIYAPHSKKREYMRQIEAILKTTKIIARDKN